MRIREATIDDIQGMQVIRNSVKENMLSDPALVPDSDYVKFIRSDGKGWVCEADDKITGFAFIDSLNKNIWALFMRPEYENKGMGKLLHDGMLNWHFSQSDETLWLGTAPNTRAERFYRLQGWREAGMHGKEIRFEMSSEDWKLRTNG